jgi:acetyl-CoA acetyltransferase
MVKHEGIGIVGYGQTPYHKRDLKPLIWYVADAMKRALTSAGLVKDDVDGLAITSFQMPPDNVTTLAQQFGIEARWLYQGAYGGASGVISVAEAANAIARGEAEVVLCVAADGYDVAGHMAMMGQFNGAMRDYLAPYGFGGTNGLFALLQRRHMHEYGTTREQLGKIAVTQRSHARLNPHALLQGPLTLEDYLQARIIADPLRLYDCVLPCGGGEAVLVTTEDRARRLRIPLVLLKATGQAHNSDPTDYLTLRGGWSRFRDLLFPAAGIGHDELDFIELYDDYPIMCLVQFEELGFCEKGAGGEFIESADFALGGDLPLNTGGGQLSEGQSGAGGGMISITEAVRQLRGEGGDRQVQGARCGLVSGFGMVGYGRGLSYSSAILATG